MPTETNETSASVNPGPSRPEKSNNKILMIVGAIVVLLILAGAAYYFLGQSSDSGGSSSYGNSNSAAESVKKSIKDLISGGDSVTCSFKDASSAGTVYVSGGKIFAEFTTTSEGVTSKGYLMQNGEYSYIWSDGNSQGVKVKLNEEDKADMPTSAVDLENEGATNCKSWSVDNSKFTAPSGITFLDVTPEANQ